MPHEHKSAAAEDADAGAKPVYLVVEHEAEQPSHSIVIAGTTTPPVMIPLDRAKRGMSFAVMDSRWIVGVGGDYNSHFTAYDPTTSTESGGPWLYENKVKPILIPHGDTLYVLSSRPKVYQGADFLPWFESIIFSNGRVPCVSYKHELPPPPIFPCCINPLEYLNPPDVRVAAYAVVDSHILLSVSFQQQHQQQDDEQQNDKGTCAFDMDRRVWDMVDGKSLPFVGQAIPLGNHLFAARPKERDGNAAVYYMALFPSNDDTSTSNSKLIILELPLNLRKGGIVSGQHLCALGMGRFSSFDARFVDRGPVEKARVIQRTYSLVNGGDTCTNLKVVKRQRQSFELLDPSSFSRPAPLVAAFTMDSE